ncbi:LysR family transcriptional regulator [Hahella ganghwensis]|uniref:LysR family transcriptional regulator n=1 Tax=Hahella ganghwensis TaxID=286420 RepID=UPI00036FBA40|nr:LysR family transcriptional regulator [Hahella ganghwensis]
MDIRSLRYFAAVFQEKNLSSAAKVCHISQPSISAAITQLESSMNVKLFVRHKKGVTPTDSAKRLYPIAKRLVSEMHSLKNLFQEEEDSHNITLGVMPSLDLDMVSIWLKHWLANIKHLDLTLVDYPGDKSDANIVSDHLIRPNDVFITLWREEYVLVAPKNRYINLPEMVTIRDINDFPYIQRKPCELDPVIKSIMIRDNVQVRIKASVSSSEWAIGLVKSGLGVAIVPESSVGRHDDVTVHRFSNVDFQRRIGLAYPEDTPVSQTLQQVISYSGGVEEFEMKRA